MILQALDRYYQRLDEDPEVDIAPMGFGPAKISFALILDHGGCLVDVHDLREPKGKKLVAKEMLAPQSVTRTVGISPNFLWDNTGYVLGADGNRKPERNLETFEAFKELIVRLGAGIEDPGLKAVLKFLESWQSEMSAGLSMWEQMEGQNLIFRLDGERCYVHENKLLQKAG